MKKIICLSAIISTILVISSCQKFGAKPPGNIEFAKGMRNEGLQTLLTWNNAGLQAWARFAFAADPAPMPESRFYAITNLAMHDALNSIRPKYKTYASVVKYPGNVSIDAAIATAAHDAMKGTYASTTAYVDSLLQVSLSPDFTVLSANYNGKKYNSPNDLVTDSKSNIYFTDPIYGLPKRAADPTRELKFEGVYKIDATGTTSLLLDSIPNPNGIALSLDEKVLYVASSEDKHPKWFAYQLDEKGNIKSGGVLLDGTALQIKATVKQGADGFKLDKYGNIFSAGPDGVNIISPAGKLLGLIKVYVRRTSNCAFNETKDVLYITADDIVLRVKLHG